MGTDIIVAQMIGTLGCGITAGGIMTLSTISIPSLVLPARQPTSATIPSHEPGTPIPHLTHQWLDLYERGKNTFPLIGLGASIANGYLAWVLRDTPAPDSALMGYGWMGCYVTAIASTMGLGVWTLTAMNETNTKLTAIATRDDAAVAEGTNEMVVGEQEKVKRAKEESEVPALLKKWAELNLCRAVFPFAGAVIGFYGVVLLK
ncbi:hypothetical protein N7478_004325 [Penicillium angulare]|uniref:uncharacterized protein n=1 Tax=Penicillium angulare TaxID=116970 RepID=UPI0025423AF5|nr:uncharacterized protein N7478_004325 [Penicillium angulare]KAJ5278953.1 hypothetical protein N7478_004325 [Penicillium angulare]